MSAPESDLSGSIETVLQGASALPSVSLYVFLGSVIGLVFLVIPVAPPIIFSECSCTTQLFAPAGGLCTACRNNKQQQEEEEEERLLLLFFPIFFQDFQEWGAFRFFGFMMFDGLDKFGTTLGEKWATFGT